jgi:hypothetical protein
MNTNSSKTTENCISRRHFSLRLLPACKIGSSLRILLPILTLSFAVVARGQYPGYLSGPAGSPMTPPGVVLKVPSTPLVSGDPVSRQRMQNALAAPAGKEKALASTNYSFVNINIPNAAYVEPTAINNSEVVAGYYADANYVTHGFVWQQGTVQTIDYPGALATAFTGINNHGVLVGTYEDDNYTTYSVTYSLVDASWSVLPNIPGGWQEEFEIAGINDEGVVIGCAAEFGILSWIWHPDSQTFSYFTAPAASEASTCAYGVNGKRNAVGTFVVAYSSSPLLFLKDHRDEFTSISLPSNLQGTPLGPFGLNNSDTIVGTFFTANFASVSGFIRYRNSSFVVVIQPGADQTYLTGINDFGVLVGDTYNTTTGASPGFIAYPLK